MEHTVINPRSINDTGEVTELNKTIIDLLKKTKKLESNFKPIH